MTRTGGGGSAGEEREGALAAEREAARDDGEGARADVAAALRSLGFAAAGEPIALEPLSGGVSSDIWRVDVGGRSLCVKRAAPRLRVAAVWEVPVERNRYEADYLRVAETIAPGLCPALLGEDPARGLLVMPYLPPERWRVWKSELRDGRVDPGVAAGIGAGLARLHGGTEDRPAIAARFATDALFDALRLDPYLRECARRHPDLAGRLEALVAATAGTRRALVHGDVSPKNVLVGPEGFRLLDAECAWFGDPAFDVAFLLNHLLLKCVWRPVHADGYRAAFHAFLDAYRDGVAGPRDPGRDGRVAALLPGLFLARVDGKSPVEYLTDEADKALVRRIARRFLLEPARRPEPLVEAVHAEVAP